MQKLAAIVIRFRARLNFHTHAKHLFNSSSFMALWLCTLAFNCEASMYHYSWYAIDAAPNSSSFISKAQKEPQGPLVISAGMNSSYSTKYFGFIEFVIENKSDSWILIKDLKISFLQPAQNKSVNITTANRLNSWLESNQARQEYIEKRNWWIFGVSISPDGLSALSNSKNSSELEQATYSVDQQLERTFGVEEFRKGLPSSHLLKGDLAIPPGLFKKRWLLLYSKDNVEIGFIDTLEISFADINGNKRMLFQKFRDKSDTQKEAWQADIPPAKR